MDCSYVLIHKVNQVSLSELTCILNTINVVIEDEGSETFNSLSLMININYLNAKKLPAFLF